MPSIQDIASPLSAMQATLTGTVGGADNLPQTKEELAQLLLRDIAAIKDADTCDKAMTTFIAAKVVGADLDLADAKTGKTAMNLIVELIAQHILQEDDEAINLPFVRKLLHMAEELMTAGVDTRCTVTHAETFAYHKRMKEMRNQLSILLAVQDPEEYTARLGDGAEFNAFFALESADATRLAAIYYLQRCFSLATALNEAVEDFLLLKKRAGGKISLASAPCIIGAPFATPFRENKAGQKTFENGAEQLLRRLMPMLTSSERKTICLELPSNSSTASLLQWYELSKEGKIPYMFTSGVAQKYSLLKFVASAKHFENGTKFLDPVTISTRDANEAVLHYSACEHLNMAMSKIRGETMGYRFINAAISNEGNVIAVVDADDRYVEVYNVLARHNINSSVALPFANTSQASEQVAKAQIVKRLGVPTMILDMYSPNIDSDLMPLKLRLTAPVAKPVTPQYANASAANEEQGYVLVEQSEIESDVAAEQRTQTRFPQPKTSA